MTPWARETLTAALLRNAYGGDAARTADAGALARYALRELACLALTDSEAVLAGRVRFSGGDPGGGMGGREEEGVGSVGSGAGGSVRKAAVSAAAAA